MISLSLVCVLGTWIESFGVIGAVRGLGGGVGDFAVSLQWFGWCLKTIVNLL